MHSNEDIVKVNNKQDVWRPLNYRISTGNEKRFVRSVCPKCNGYHDVYMLWTGRGMPRIFCGHCKVAVAGYDDMVLSEPSVFSAGPARKKGKSVE